MRNAISFFLLISLSYCSIAQYQIGLIPRVSPDRSVTSKVGYTDISITYGSPKVNNRQIWGELVPYDVVWRAGANNATNIEFSEDVFIEDHLVEKGRYALFIVPRSADMWSIILNSEYEQWGSFKYDSKNDILSIEVLPEQSDRHMESLRYDIENYGHQFAKVSMNWETKRISFEVKTAYVDLLEREIESRVETLDETISWIPYLQGADFLINQNRNYELAANWIKVSEKMMKETDLENWDKRFYPLTYLKAQMYWLKARVMANASDFEKAIFYVDKCKATSDKFYQRENKYEDIDSQYEYWKSKIE